MREVWSPQEPGWLPGFFDHWISGFLVDIWVANWQIGSSPFTVAVEYKTRVGITLQIDVIKSIEQLNSEFIERKRLKMRVDQGKLEKRSYTRIFLTCYTRGFTDKMLERLIVLKVIYLYCSSERLRPKRIMHSTINLEGKHTKCNLSTVKRKIQARKKGLSCFTLNFITSCC